MDVFALADELTNGPHRLALADDDVRFNSAFVEDLADRGADDSFDTKALLFLDRRLDSAKLHEVLRLDDPQRFDAPVRLGGAARGEAQSYGGFDAVVDHDQVGAL